MKTTDLMIGDWVLAKGKLTQVTDIDEYEGINRIWIAGCEDGGCIGKEDIKPIPLTPEILEKNGFVISSEHANLYFSESDEKMSFCLRKMYDKLNNFVFYGSICYNIVSPIKYVHELKHALKLCKIDKEIVL